MKRAYHRSQPRLEIPWKEWLHAEAENLGLRPHTLNTRILRHKHPAPGFVKRGPRGRAISVILPVNLPPQNA